VFCQYLRSQLDRYPFVDYIRFFLDLNCHQRAAAARAKAAGADHLDLGLKTLGFHCFPHGILNRQGS